MNEACHTNVAAQVLDSVKLAKPEANTANAFRNALRSLSAEDDFSMVFEGLCRLLNNPHQANNTLLPSSMKQVYREKGSVLQCVAVCCGVLQCVAVCCSVLQCVAVCCSVLQCVAVCLHETGLQRERKREKERERKTERHNNILVPSYIKHGYGVGTISRLLEIISLFCRI